MVDSNETIMYENGRDSGYIEGYESCKEHLIEYLLSQKYITVDESSLDMTEEFEKEHKWELSRNYFINKVIKYIEDEM